MTRTQLFSELQLLSNNAHPDAEVWDMAMLHKYIAAYKIVNKFNDTYPVGAILSQARYESGILPDVQTQSNAFVDAQGRPVVRVLGISVPVEIGAV